MQVLVDTVRERWGLKCAILHRFGYIPVGEAAVVVCVSSHHRAEAFDACEWTINTLKADVPVWKKEFAEGGTFWIEGDELVRSIADAVPALRSDPLTGLPSGQALLERISQEVAHALADGTLLALVHLDVDRFKSFNNAYGDAFGSALMKALAARIRTRLRAGETLGRLRSDEFLIAHPGLKRPDDAAELCGRLNETFAEPF